MTGAVVVNVMASRCGLAANDGLRAIRLRLQKAGQSIFWNQVSSTQANVLNCSLSKEVVKLVFRHQAAVLR